MISQEGSMVNVHVDNSVLRSYVLINPRSDVAMMNSMMLLFMDLKIQILFHSHSKMKTSMNQALLEVIMLRLTLVSRLTGSVELASVMLWNFLAATLVSVGTCQE